MRRGVAREQREEIVHGVGPAARSSASIRAAWRRGVASRRATLFARRRAQQLRRRADLHQHAAVHHRDAVAEDERLRHVVSHEDRRHAEGAANPLELLLERVARERVERAEGLVHQQQLRLGGERAREADALLLPARELRRRPRSIRSRLELDERQQLVDARADARLRPPEQARRHRDVLCHREVRKEPDLLEAIADAPAQQRRGLGADVATADPDRAAVGLDQAVHHLEGRGLPAARAAHQHEQLAAAGAQRQPVDGDRLAVALAHPVDFDRRHARADAIRSRRMPIRAVVFDLFDTLVDLPMETLPRVAVGGREIPSTAGALHAALAPSAQRSRSKSSRASLQAVDREWRATHWERDRELPTDERFARVARALGLADPAIPRRLTDIHMGMIESIAVTPSHHPALLAALQRAPSHRALLELLVGADGARDPRCRRAAPCPRRRRDLARARHAQAAPRDLRRYARRARASRPTRRCTSATTSRPTSAARRRSASARSGSRAASPIPRRRSRSTRVRDRIT